MPSPIVEGFSLTHAQILDGATPFVTAALATSSDPAEDIYGVNDGSLTPDTGEYENEGDDVVLSTWSWLNFAEVEVQAGYLSFPLIASITGEELWSSGAGSNQMFGVDLWTEDSMNVQPRPMILKMPSKDKDGLVRTLTIGLYKVQFRPMTFDGPSYKEGLKVNYTGRALMSDVDEEGNAFAVKPGKKRVGRLLSHA